MPIFATGLEPHLDLGVLIVSPAGGMDTWRYGA
jgi:hypothetical protein